MSMVFEYWGMPLTAQRIVPGNTACGTLSTSVYYTEWTSAYTGGKTGLAVGSWLVGATSGVIAQVVSLTITSGTLAGNNAAGVLRLKSKYHPSTPATQWTSGETFNIAGSGNGAFTLIPLVAAKTDLYAFPKGTPAKCALVTALTQTELVNFDGGIPDQTSLAGLPMKDGTSLLLRDINEIIRFMCIDYTNNSAGSINIQFFF